MLRSELQTLARLRLREAKQLLDAGKYCGAYHFTGMAVECAIKACIAKQTQRYEFPDKNRANECFSHDPSKLVKLAGLDQRLKTECTAEPQFDKNWGVVKDWKVDSRYDHSISKTKARAIYSAVVSRRHGVLRWLRQYW